MGQSAQPKQKKKGILSMITIVYSNNVSTKIILNYTSFNQVGCITKIKIVENNKIKSIIHKKERDKEMILYIRMILANKTRENKRGMYCKPLFHIIYYTIEKLYITFHLYFKY